MVISILDRKLDVFSGVSKMKHLHLFFVLLLHILQGKTFLILYHILELKNGLRNIHILRKQRGLVGGVGHMLTFAYMVGGWVKANAYVSKITRKK